MFRDLQPGSTVSVLDKTGGIARLMTGTVKSVGVPRFDTRPDKALTGEKVVDLTVELEGNTYEYCVTEGANIISNDKQTMACDPSMMVFEVKAFMKRSEDGLAMQETYMKNVDACKEILEQISPEYAASQSQNKRIDRIESSVDRLAGIVESLAEQLKSERSVKKNEK